MLLLYYLTIEKLELYQQAFEYYLMQNELADNTMLGSKYNRKKSMLRWVPSL
jgi:hypothetical protein